MVVWIGYFTFLIRVLEGLEFKTPAHKNLNVDKNSYISHV
jgi:hypothetical protein